MATNAAMRHLPFICFFAAAFAGCTSVTWIEVDCPSAGRTVKVLRDTSAAYTVYAAAYETGFRAGVHAIDSLVLNIHTETPFRPLLLGLRRDIRRERSAIRSRLPATVSRLQTNPCGRNEQHELEVLLKRIEYGAEELRKITRACRDTTSELESLIRDYRIDKD